VFGLSGEKLVILAIIAAFVLGPERLPQYAQKLAQLVKSVKRMAEGAKNQLSEEIGEEVDWKKLDPRQYDPRKIIRDALADNDGPNTAQVLNSATKTRLKSGESAPFDSEAT
jgi:sec-independent protein translocase protein TatB